MTTMLIAPPFPTPVKVTPEELDRLPDAVRFELVDGQLVERNMGLESSQVAVNVSTGLNAFCRRTKSAAVYGADAGYRCYPDDPDKIRKPDVSAILTGRLPENRSSIVYCRVAPDLVVDVISPNDLSYDVEEKVREYLAAGVRLVWVVHPPPDSSAFTASRERRPVASRSLARPTQSPVTTCSLNSPAPSPRSLKGFNQPAATLGGMTAFTQPARTP